MTPKDEDEIEPNTFYLAGKPLLPLVESGETCSNTQEVQVRAAEKAEVLTKVHIAFCHIGWVALRSIVPSSVLVTSSDACFS